jgi:Polysulphide reductase, NrfD
VPTYEDLPLLKRPVWTWEVPAYFFVGGAAGAAAVVGVAAEVGGAKDIARDARWIAAIGAVVSGPLLVMDLGRPERFLNMLRVFKPQSPMSVGAWTLAGFGGAATAAVVVPNRVLRNVAATASAVTGLGMCTYTGVLIGATVIPVWKRNVKLLPVLFGASALGAAVSLLELRGHKHPALNALGIGAALFETAAEAPKSTIAHIAGALSGPIPFLLRLLGARKLAAAATVAGSLATRIAWIEAGKASASEIGVALEAKRP